MLSKGTIYTMGVEKILSSNLDKRSSELMKVQIRSSRLTANVTVHSQFHKQQAALYRLYASLAFASAATYSVI